jgi:dihydropteroate synthase
MGIVNVTPDSFSDGGSYAGPDEAVQAGTGMVAAGADIVDVGGESTRPGALRVDEAEELRRVQPVVARLAAAGVTVSVDTTRSRVAAAALDAGAVLVNDVSGAREPDLLDLVAERGVPYVLMHSRGTSAQMARRAVYGDVVPEVAAELSARLEAVVAAGVAEDRVIVDPGIGFAKTAEHNWELLARLGEIAALGRPMLVGTSRKSFLGALLAAADGTPRPVTDRDDATQATTALLAAAGVWAVRVHAVRPAADAVRVAGAWCRPTSAYVPASVLATGSVPLDASRGGFPPSDSGTWASRTRQIARSAHDQMGHPGAEGTSSHRLRPPGPAGEVVP